VQVAYKPDLPHERKIHPVFHVSLLKKAVREAVTNLIFYGPYQIIMLVIGCVFMLSWLGERDLILPHTSKNNHDIDNLINNKK
jgi:hypothetical protein